MKLWEKIHKKELKEYLNTCNWEGNGLHEMSDIFVVNLSLALKKFVPVKIIHPNKSKDLPWFTNEVKMYEKLTNHEEDWSMYKSLRNMCGSMMDKEKKKYFEREIDKSKYDMKNMWKTIKFLDGSRGTTDDILKVHIEGDESLSENNQLNNFYVNSVLDIVNSIPKISQVENDTIKDISFVTVTYSLFEFKEIDLPKLYKVVFSMRNKKAAPDHITANLTSETFIEIIKSTYSESWKTCLVIPIPKKKNPLESHDLRPINCLPVYEKILEIILHE
ncbi:hypothetical protein J437_LFUL017200 [Ladona fulva]|uniref:Uncharacterized protein n=1 Tax=Ladona fulva TaxID=123851 RepID=A0A8K0PCE0_LADFU|nr:hypothetical protein J437_LFUL017200 [Ladona fulva]